MQPEESRKVREAGERLRQIRLRRGLSTRRVAELSQIVANEEAREEFAISHGRLVQIETQGSVPSICKVFTLSAIYGVPLTELLSAFVDLSTLGRLHHSLNATHTHPLLQDQPPDIQKTIAFPVRFDSSVRPEQTNLLSRMVEEWGEVPLGILAHLNIRKHRYGWIGLSDYTMFPIIRPGSPRGTPENRPMRDTSKAANGREAGQELLYRAGVRSGNSFYSL